MKKIKCDPSTKEDLRQGVNDLERDKSRDTLDRANGLFKDDVAVTDLKLVLLKFMNHIKKKHECPQALQICNITSIYKHKGSHKDFNNYRGVF